MATLDAPPSYVPPPPPSRTARPKITLQIPDAPAPMTPRTASVYYGSPRFPKVPGTPGSHMSDPQHPYLSPFGHMYHSKASEFMFKQFEGFKDFTMNTAKSGLSVGEKTAFWLYNKLRVLSRRWFTHLFLTFSLVLYSVIGATIFTALEKPKKEKKYDICSGKLDIKRDFWHETAKVLLNIFYCVFSILPILFYIALAVACALLQSGICFIFCQCAG